MALQWTPLQLPLANGLQQKYDARSRPTPALDICRDAQFDELGGLQTRYPFAAMSNAIFGGGTLSNCRRLAVVNDELLVFTDTALYSWNAQLSKWVRKGAHLAVKVDEVPRFVTTDDQIDSDRAELNNTVVYTWAAGSGASRAVYVAATDKTTGSVLMAPTALAGATFVLPRLVALSTKILLFVQNVSADLNVFSIDPADPATSIAAGSTNLMTGTANLYYDVVRIASTDAAVLASRRQVTTSYTVFKVTASIVVTAVTKARTCDGPIAVSVDPTGTNVQIVRGNGANIQGDLLLISTFADVFTAQAIGTATVPVNQIAVAHSSTSAGGVYTANAWWSFTETSSTGFATFATKRNTVTTANVVGTQANFVLRVGVAARAFDYNGDVYVWLVFAEDSAAAVIGTPLGVRAALQNTYFLYRSDGLIVAKSTTNVAGGYAPSTGHLPGVAGSGSAFAWASGWRRAIELGGDRGGYAARSLRDVTFTFDTNAARRTARLGSTMYIACGLPLQYDGVTLTEVGFLVFPWAIDAQNSGIAGNIIAGTYNWKGTIRWQNATGESERSTTASGVQVALPASRVVFVSSFPLYVTLKQAATTGVRPPAMEFWRTPASAQSDSPYYLITGVDPGVTTGDNPYIANDPTSNGYVFNDNFSDTTLTTKETNPENGGVLEVLPPPAASIIVATDTRVFLGGVAGDPDRVWYSRLRGAGEVASFNDTLTIDVPRVGGDITAIDFLNDTLIVFRETAVYAFGGDGLDNTGGGQNYGPARTVASDVGAVSQEAVVLAPMGLVFKSRNGWHLLDVGWGAKYIGDKVSAFDGDTVLAMHLVDTQHHIRILTNNRVVIWDYYANQWGEWSIADGIDSTIWNGTHVYLTATGPKQQLATYTGLTYGMDAELTWIKPADLQGAIAVRWFEVLGEYRSSCLVRMRVARDYQYDGAGNPVYFDDFTWSPSPSVVGSALQVRHSPSIQKVEAFKVRITAIDLLSTAALDSTTLNVLTSSGVWDANWLAIPLGVAGNAVTISLAFEDGAPFAIDVRDHFTWSHTLQRWREDLNNVGIKITCRTGSSPTVGQLDAAIIAGSTLIENDTPAGAPSRVINAAAMVNLTRTGSFAGGSYGVPTGEAIKLTGLGLEVGAQPGLFRRLPASQKA